MDVELVVISVNVQSHYALAKPALQAGKDVFMEWPVGINVEEAEELTQIAHDKGIKTMVSLQARPSPIVQKIKEIIAGNDIG
jgi:predicted dehydrogenase